MTICIAALCDDSRKMVVAIGTGDTHAISTLIYNEYTQKVSLNRALYLVYESKKAAERAPGVGEAQKSSGYIQATRKEIQSEP